MCVVCVTFSAGAVSFNVGPRLEWPIPVPAPVGEAWVVGMLDWVFVVVVTGTSENEIRRRPHDVIMYYSLAPVPVPLPPEDDFKISSIGEIKMNDLSRIGHHDPTFSMNTFLGQ